MARSGLVPIFYKSIQNTTSLNGLSQPHNPKLDLNLFHAYHTSGTFLKQCHHPLHLHRVQPLCAMSKPRMPPFSSLIPQLTPDNFLEWQVCVKAYLTPSDHVCMVEQVRTMGGAYVDPLPPSDPADLTLWESTEHLRSRAFNRQCVHCVRCHQVCWCSCFFTPPTGYEQAGPAHVARP